MFRRDGFLPPQEFTALVKGRKLGIDGGGVGGPGVVELAGKRIDGRGMRWGVG